MEKELNHTSIFVQEKSSVLSLIDLGHQLNNYKCRICKEHFFEQQKLMEHQKCHEERPFKCAICQKTFVLSKDQKQHNKLYHIESPHKCDLCEKTCKNECRLIIHKRLHTGERPYKCEVCEKTFTIHNNMQRHMNIHTGQKRYQCISCEKLFTYLDSLKRHIVSHSAESLYSCFVCKKRFHNVSEMKTHMRVHTGEKPYSCKICKKKFSILTHMKRHVKKHTEDRHYKCPVCEEIFSASCALANHVQSHPGERHFRCNTCGKQFKDYLAVKRHVTNMHNIQSSNQNNFQTELNVSNEGCNSIMGEIMHSPQNSYKCKLCEKTLFNQSKSSVIRHMRCHKDKKQYKCPVCEKIFFAITILTQHVSTHPGERHFKCILCDKQFKDYKAMTRHAIKLHSRKNPKKSSSTKRTISLPKASSTSDIEEKQTKYIEIYNMKESIGGKRYDISVGEKICSMQTNVMTTKEKTALKNRKSTKVVLSWPWVDFRRNTLKHQVRNTQCQTVKYRNKQNPLASDDVDCKLAKKIGGSYEKTGVLFVVSKILYNEMPYSCGECLAIFQTKYETLSHYVTHHIE